MGTAEVTNHGFIRSNDIVSSMKRFPPIKVLSIYSLNPEIQSQYSAQRNERKGNEFSVAGAY
jgi:hypothetical protein